MAVAHEQDLRDFASLLLVEGLEPRTLQSLAIIAEVVHETPSRFSDPARFPSLMTAKTDTSFPFHSQLMTNCLESCVDHRKLGALDIQRNSMGSGVWIDSLGLWKQDAHHILLWTLRSITSEQLLLRSEDERSSMKTYGGDPLMNRS